MSKTIQNYFKKYRSIVFEIDRQTNLLEDLHRNHLNCKNGCDLCCIGFSIFPVEYHFILNELKKEVIHSEPGKKPEDNVCAFLKNHSCTIYKHRPIMCRTHGFPLLYTNDEGEFELSVCELNFTEFEVEDFTMENTLPQDKYNSKLFLLNREFIAAYKDKMYNETDLIPMKELAEEIKDYLKV